MPKPPMESSAYTCSIKNLMECYQDLSNSLLTYETSVKDLQLEPSLTNLWINPKGIINLVQILTANLSEIEPSDISYRLESEIYESVTPKLKEGQEDSVCANLKVEEDENYGDSISKEMRNIHNRRYVRGPYRNYTNSVKKNAVYMLTVSELPLSEISRKLKIPCKNIKRWAMEGVERKKGGGRKRFNPVMEEQIYNHLCENYQQGDQIKMEEIQNIALSLTKDEQFKASRGWTIKFLLRYHVKERFQIC